LHLSRGENEVFVNSLFSLLVHWPLEQIGVVTAFSQLHDYVLQAASAMFELQPRLLADNFGESLFQDSLVIFLLLWGERRGNDSFLLLWQLQFNVRFESSKQEGSQNLMELGDNVVSLFFVHDLLA
jgi:hypothetical protein